MTSWEQLNNMIAAKQLKHFSSTSQKEINMYDIKQPSSISQAPLMQKYTCLLSKLCQTTLKHLSSTSHAEIHMCVIKQMPNNSQVSLKHLSFRNTHVCYQTTVKQFYKHISNTSHAEIHMSDTNVKQLSNISQAHLKHIKKTTMLESNPGAFGGSSMSPASCRCGIEKKNNVTLYEYLSETRTQNTPCP